MKKSPAMRIKAARAKLGLSQKEAARKWGFSLSTLEAWEQGYRNPAGLYLLKLEGILAKIERDAKKVAPLPSG